MNPTPIAAPGVSVATFRKKPVDVEAVQMTEEVAAAFLFDKVPLPAGVEFASASHKNGVINNFHASIETLEGRMNVSLGDWIITGVKGERYPCKPDIFEMTYERTALLASAAGGQEPMVDMGPPATSRDRWMYEQGRLAERDPRTPAPVGAPQGVTEAMRQIEEAIKFYGDIQYERGPGEVPGSFAESQRRLKRALECVEKHLAATPAGAVPEPPNRNDPLSALAIRLLVTGGHVTQAKADEAFGIACSCMEVEASKMNVELPWVTRAALPLSGGVQGDAALLAAVNDFASKVIRFGETSDVGMFSQPNSAGMRAMGDDHINVQFMVRGNFGTADALFDVLRPLMSSQQDGGSGG